MEERRKLDREEPKFDRVLIADDNEEDLFLAKSYLSPIVRVIDTCKTFECVKTSL